MKHRSEFSVKGSKGDVYQIVFARTDNNLTVTCTCPAGEVGTHCKHRLALLEGLADNLLSNNKDDLAKLFQLISGTDVEVALARYHAAEQAYQDAKRALTGAKKGLARAMRD